MSERELDRVREIVLALPGVNERFSHGAPCFFVRDKRPLAYYHDDHNGDGRISLWCPVPPGVQDEMVNAEPDRYFRPITSARGAFGNWLGVFLDVPKPGRVRWQEVAALVEDVFRHVAPKALLAELDRR